MLHHSPAGRLIVSLGLVLVVPWSALGQGVSSDWFCQPAISPDGSRIVFVSGGDLYSVPTGGGRAVPLTVHEAHETEPVWSHDGERLAFASDRNGNFDVYVMPAGGGEARRLTHHSADDFPTDFTMDNEGVIFESSRVDDASSPLFPSGILSELYEVSVEGGTPEMVLTVPALNARFGLGGERIVYEDRKGYEDPFRKHHTSSIARDVWVYDIEGESFEKLTEYAGEDRDPHVSRSGGDVFFLSERGGDFNVHRMPMGRADRAVALTDFEDHPVRQLSKADDDTLAFSWHGEIYTLDPGGEARKVDIEIALDGRSGEAERTTMRSGVTDFAVSPSGKEIAFVVRGEVFATSVEFGTTTRITDTPEQERSVDFAPDGRSLVYAGERGGSWNVYESSLVDDEELYFFSATKIEETPLVATDAEEFQPVYSPDGEKVAYLHDRTVLKVLDLESEETVTALSGDTYYSYSDGDHWFDWSPDSRWLTVHFYNRGRAFVPEVGIVPADGSDPEPVDISKSGYDDNTPTWAMGGGAIIWKSARYGERSHGSWGSEYDVIGAFLTRDAYDRFTMSKEEYELSKELEEKKKEEEEEAEDEGSEDTDDEEGETEEGASEPSDRDDGDDVEPIEINLENIEDRTARLTIHASDLSDAVMSPEGEKLYYLAKFEKGYDLWEHDFREGTTKILAKLGAGSATMELSEDGETIFMLADGSLSKIETSSGTKKGISFAAQMEIDGDGERSYLFDHVWRQTKQKFYRPDMHGVDWSFYRDQYEPKLEGINNNRDFAVILSEMLGELNASHTGGRYRPGGEEGDASTAALGVIFDRDFGGDGLRIEEILAGGPLDTAESEIESGMVVAAIDGTELDGAVNAHALLNNKAGERVRLTVERGDGARFEEVVKPISFGAQNNLLYERWTRGRRGLVDELSDGRLGYAHVRGMNDASFRAFYSDVMGRHFDKEGLIVDTRFNGGGWLHDDLVTFLTGEAYVYLYPRNIAAPDTSYFGDPLTRWTKPSAVVMSEGNYSDAHFFPWAYTEVGIGETIGMPVPGTSTAVWWERLHTGDLIFGIPQVGTKGKDGEYLENEQLEPTHRQPLGPDAVRAGRDTQIEKAVEVLLETVESE